MASLSLAGFLSRLPAIPASRSILFSTVPCGDPFSGSFLPYPSPSTLIRGKIALRRAFPRRFGGVDVDEGELEEWAEEEDSEVDEGGGPDDLSSFDLELMEQEAIDAVREYSLSLSGELVLEDEVSERRHTTEKQRIKKKISKHIPDHILPKVTIVGRPNVGKSALFNRLVGGNRAIVVDEPGVTRDRLYGRSSWGDREFMVVDTGGIMTFSRSQADVMEELAISTTIGMDGIPLTVREAAVARMPSMIERQATAAVEESSVIIFLVDGQAGLVASDMEIADWLRKHYSNKCIILAVNKCESPRKGLMQASEFWSLGFSPIPISAISGTGTGELLDLVCSELKATEALDNIEGEENYIPSIAIVGRPNVGKSSILNALVGEERTIVSPISGTTRDAIDTEIAGPDGQKYKLIDTAGIRRRAAVASAGSTTEALSVNRAFRAIRRTDVVALVIEAMACITEQDVRIAERIEREGKGCIIVVNKWDTIPKKSQHTTTYYEQDVREKLRLLDWAPIAYSTAITGRSVDKIIAAVAMVEKERSRRLGTSILNQVVQEALAFKPPPRTRGGKRGRIYYSTQAATKPPTFVFFVNDAKLFPETYRRYMEKQLRKDAGFPGTPIRLLWRSRRRGDKGEKCNRICTYLWPCIDISLCAAFAQVEMGTPVLQLHEMRKLQQQLEDKMEESDRFASLIRSYGVRAWPFTCAVRRHAELQMPRSPLLRFARGSVFLLLYQSLVLPRSLPLRFPSISSPCFGSISTQVNGYCHGRPQLACSRAAGRGHEGAPTGEAPLGVAGTGGGHPAPRRRQSPRRCSCCYGMVLMPVTGFLGSGTLGLAGLSSLGHLMKKAYKYWC